MPGKHGPSQAQVARVKRQNTRDAKSAGVDLNAPRKPGDAAKLNATIKARRILREMAAKKRGASAVSGLRPSTKPDAKAPVSRRPKMYRDTENEMSKLRKTHADAFAPPRITKRKKDY